MVLIRTCCLRRIRYGWRPGDAVGITEEALLATYSLVITVGHKVPISKKDYVEPPRSLAG